MLFVTLLCLAILVYAYGLFPAIVFTLARIRPRQWRRSSENLPFVTVILPVYNEERILDRSLRALLAQDYPADRFEVLCGSDGSSDASVAIMRSLANEFPNLKPVVFLERRGKMMVLNDLVREARGEVLFFSDADVTLTSNAVRLHAQHYSDDSVGGVTGPLVFSYDHKDATAISEGGFLSFENRLREAEALVFSTTGFYGCNWSMRHALWRDMPSQTTCDDFFAYLAVVDAGSRLVFERGAVAREHYGRSFEDEFSRKCRYAARTIDAISHFPQLMWRSPVAWFIWPRKIIRWTTSFLLAAIVACTVAAFFSHENWSSLALAIETMFAGLVLIGWIGRKHSIPIASPLFWFFGMNLAFVKGLYQYVFAKQEALWQQTTRVSH